MSQQPRWYKTRVLRVLVEASCLVDARRDAGIGRYAGSLIDALERLPGLALRVARPARPPLSESRPGRFIHAQPVALREAARVRPDLLHALGGEPVAGFPLRRQVVTVHDVEMWHADGRSPVRDAALRAYGLTLAALIRECGAVIAVSPTSAAEAISTLRLDPERVHVVPEGVGPPFTAAPADDDATVVAAAGLVAGEYVLWAGSLRHHDPRKGLDDLVEAVGRLGPGGPPLALVGAGDGGVEAARLRALAAGRGCRLVLGGRLGDAGLAALYRQAGVVAIASTHEGFGLAALEAMACGAPVVATAAGNLPELCGQAGLLVPPSDPAALAGALRAVLEDGVRATGMREAGRLRATAFTWERAASETAAVYRRLLSSSSRSGTGTSPAR